MLVLVSYFCSQIEKGQPVKATAVLQTIQFTTLNVCIIVASTIGGYFTANGKMELAFFISGVLYASVTIIVLLIYQEHPGTKINPSRPSVARPFAVASILYDALKAPSIQCVCIFLLLFCYSPFSSVLQYEYLTVDIKLTEEQYGLIGSVRSAAAIVGVICWRFSFARLKIKHSIYLAIVLGMAAGSMWLLVTSFYTASFVAFCTGIAGSFAIMTSIGLAAQVCPVETAGTVYALLMSTATLTGQLGVWSGGQLTELLYREVFRIFIWSLLFL